MTWEEINAKAEEHARSAGIPVERLHSPKVRETVLVSFLSKTSPSSVKFHLDAVTGDLIGTEFTGPEFAPEVPAKQLSKRSQRVLALASKESKRVGCDHVGSDHLLLAVLEYGEGIGAAVLTSAGLTAEAVRGRILAVGSAAEVASHGYGPSLRNILRLSCHYAETFGHSEIDPEHFVLSLLDKADGPAMNLFRHFAINVEQVKTSLSGKL